VQIGKPQVEQSIAEREGLVDESRPCLGTDEPVLHDAVLALEVLDSCQGGPEEDPVDPGRPEVVAERQETALYVLHGRAAIVGPDWSQMDFPRASRPVTCRSAGKSAPYEPP
jgi:hypothetical protein